MANDLYKNVFKGMNGLPTRKNINKLTRKKVDAVNAKYADAFAPDAVADVARASRTEERRSQRRVKTGRSSTILSMRDEMGMDAIGIPNQMNVNKMEGRSVEDKLKSQQKGEIGSIKKDYVGQLGSIGKQAYIKNLQGFGMDASAEIKLDMARRKKKAEIKDAYKSGGFKAVSRIGGL